MRFQGTDKDHNGSVDRSELGELIQDLGIALKDKDVELEVLFEQIDENHGESECLPKTGFQTLK